MKKNTHTSTQLFSNSYHSKYRFGLMDNGNVYSKNAQPAQDIFCRRLARLYNSKSILSCKTDIIVESMLSALASGNEKIAVSSAIFPPLHNAILSACNKLGVRIVYFNDFEALTEAVQQNVKAVIMSCVSVDCCYINIHQAKNICKKAEIPFIVDNTIATVFSHNPLLHGANIVIEMSHLVSAGDEQNSYTSIMENGSFNWLKNNGYSKLYPYRNSNYPLTAYTRAKCKRANNVQDKETQADYYMLCEGLRTLYNRFNVHNYNSYMLVKLLQKYAYNVSYNYYNSKHPVFITVDLIPKYTPKLEEKLFISTVKSKEQLCNMFNCTSVYFQENTAYIKIGTEPFGYLKLLFNI